MALTKFNYNSFNVTPVASKALAFNSGADGLTTADESSMVLIKTLTASDDGTLSFVDGASDVVLDNTYPTYLFKFINVNPASGASNPKFQFNGSDDASSHAYDVNKTTATLQSYHTEGDTAASVFYNTSFDLSEADNTDYGIVGTAFQSLNFGDGNVDADASGSGELWLFNPSSTTFVTHFMTDFNNCDSDPSTGHYKIGGYFNVAAAITAIQFKYSSGNVESGTIKLYGIKDS